MGRKQTEEENGPRSLPILVLVGAVASCIVFLVFHFLLKPATEYLNPVFSGERGIDEAEENACCRGVEHLELWGTVVKWGTDFKVNSSRECCLACKDMCNGDDGTCLCNSWVYCGNKQACGSNYGECWLKQQKVSVEPEVRESGDQLQWTSGLVFGGGQGIIGFETKYGVLRVKLLADCAPISVSYILELLKMRHTQGCYFYRAEGRGGSWDTEGNHIQHASYGPPFAMLQGRLERHGLRFKGIPSEFSPMIKRGSVAWLASGPEFFISLAHHEEWRRAYTVFGYVLPEDMGVAEKIANLPTKHDTWNNIDVAILENPVRIHFRQADVAPENQVVTSTK